MSEIRSVSFFVTGRDKARLVSGDVGTLRKFSSQSDNFFQTSIDWLDALQMNILDKAEIFHEHTIY